MRSIVLFLAMVLSLAGFAQEPTLKSYIISNVTVVPMDSERVLEGHNVVVEGGKITYVGTNAQNIRGAVKIDGTGKFLSPGLAEMHAHIPQITQGEDYVKEVLFLYLSNGITTIRGMLGAPYHLQLKRQVERHAMLGPRIYTSSPSMNGNSIPTKDIAREKVSTYKVEGYDFLKVHPGIKLDVFNEMVRTANDVGIGYSGHVPVDVGIRRALESRYGSIDHADGYLEGLVPASADVNPNANGFFGFNFTDLADESLIPELVELTLANNVWVVPTQSLTERWAGDKTAQELAMDPEMIYISANTRNSWIKAVENFQQSPDYSAARATRFNALRRQIIKSLHDGGVGILLGSDAPQIFNVPGFSIQHELGYMVQCGLTPYQAIRTGTVNPAAFFDSSSEYGMIKEGLSADLVLLNSNPLTDVDAYSSNDGVMVRGVWLSRSEIDKRLAAIAKKYQN